MKSHTRRQFLQTSTKAGATAALAMGFPAILRAGSWSHPPSDQLNIGLIGSRNRGFRVLKQHLDLGGINCVALCDVDESVLAEKKEVISKDYGQKVRTYPDFRTLLADREVDAVIIATPDHWHCLQTIYAIQAEKDVYVEKPMANSIGECQLIVKAANQSQQIIQVGQQQRSGEVWNVVVDFLKAGKLGTIRKTNIWANFNYGLGPQKQADAPVPQGVDYDMYLGPAPERPFNPARFHGGWRHFWDYGGGLMTDFGAHLIDMALWVKDITAPPTQVMAYGTHLDRPDLAKETYDTMSVVFPMDDYIIQWESNAGKQVGPYDRLYGLAFLGDLGTLVVDRSGWQVLPEWDNDRKAYKVAPFTSEKFNGGHDLHIRNFVECIKSREKPVCPPEIGSNVAHYAHMANIAVRTGLHKLEWNAEKGKFRKARAANKLIMPKYRKPWKLPRI